jgi:hypothetical protein
MMTRIVPPFGLASLWAAGGGSFDPSGLEADIAALQAKVPGPTGLRFNAFRIRFVNTAGTLQHLIEAPSGMFATPQSASLLAPDLNNHSTTFANTPAGLDSTTAMVNGLKVASDNAAFIWLDTPPQDGTKSILIPKIFSNDSDTIVEVNCAMLSADINGVSRVRPMLSFQNPTNGALVGINTTTLGAGEQISVACNCWLLPAA